MRRLLIERVKKAVQEWAKQYPKVELVLIKVYPSGIGENIHVIVVASQGFDDWEQSTRRKDLYWFLRKQLDPSDVAKISLLLTMTEEQYDKYEVNYDEALT
jgi:hypothetical protein